ncbi:cuticle protein 16.5-like [Photinus pyralis]|uniref:cuticle protein 16.5-like n=1 Tax=Photinus pyralis TaxID=7054 RepID=UPI0012674125|nr:cuticle protein 16.5-like [Photinus pyralis]XP_031343100.1 cuticle protein 16.5-like [Photinus pyralis]
MQLETIFLIVAVAVSVCAENYAPAASFEQTEFELPASTYGAPRRPARPFTSYQVPTIPAPAVEYQAPVVRYTPAPRRVIQYEEIPEIEYENVQVTVRKPVVRYRLQARPITVIRAPSRSYGVPVAPSTSYGAPAF